MDAMQSLFRPESIAVIGASRDPKGIGYQCLKNMIDSGYKGKMYPVNPKADEICGIKVYHNVTEIPEKVDLGLIVVPAKFAIQAVEDCGKKGIKSLAVISSGFSEIGNDDLEKQLVDTAAKYGTRILGPNIVGVLNNPLKCNASFAPYLPYHGTAALISQSGALLIGIDARSWIDKIGISHMVSIGNMADVDFADLVEFFSSDKDTQAVSLYIEGFKNGRRFLEVAKKSSKPIIALKSGVSKRGAAAAASHTGSLAGSSKVYDAAFRQSKVISAHDLDDLFERTMALSLQPPMHGKNVLVITNGGGVGVMSTDSAEKYGIPLEDAPEDLKAMMRKHMPEFGSPKNPVDITGQGDRHHYYNAVKDALSHNWVDALVVLYCETSLTNPDEIAQGICDAVKEANVRKIPIAISFVGGERCINAGAWLVKNGLPYYKTPDGAMNGMGALREYAIYSEEAANEFKPWKVDKKAALDIIAAVRKEGRNALTEPEAKLVFAAYGLPIPKGKLARNVEEALKVASEVAYPVVMKIVSPEIIHKSDAGGVKVNLKTPEDVRAAYDLITANARKYNAKANIHGVYVQNMAPWGTETIIGSTNDAQFGPTVMFGLGGVFVEVMKDVSFRIAPIGQKEAQTMASEIKGYKILEGTRGEKRKDINAVTEAVSKLSQLVHDLQNEVAEVDANPVIVYEDGKGLSVVDARIILK
ncbi:MAG: acetate--CoA ligase family protein [Candidatus Thermoplasmatota archaeon]|nr:acetate--CoA ligase family protein [Candidatus Thermoplasmatota archaeon]